MPILEENRGRYPADWPKISRRIRNDRAEGRCECEGECGTGHIARCPARQGQPHPITTARVQLTVAHLDHQPENCSDENLRAMCQRCHLCYDAAHHAATRAARRVPHDPSLCRCGQRGRCLAHCRTCTCSAAPAAEWSQMALFPVDSQGRVGQDLFENGSD